MLREIPLFKTIATCEFTALKSLLAISMCQKGCSWLQLQVELLEAELNCICDSERLSNAYQLNGAPTAEQRVRCYELGPDYFN